MLVKRCNNGYVQSEKILQHLDLCENHVIGSVRVTSEWRTVFDLNKLILSFDISGNDN